MHSRRIVLQRLPPQMESVYVLSTALVLPDPGRIHSGSGKQTRFVRLPSAKMLEQSEVRALLRVAAEKARVPLPRSGRGKLIIGSASAKQRPRRKPQKA